MFTIDSKGPVSIRIYRQQKVLNKDFAIAVPPGSMVEIHFYERDGDSKVALDCDVEVEHVSEINFLDAPLKAPREDDSGGRQMMCPRKYARIKKQLDDELDAYYAQCPK